jgi:hypothetical protein
MMVRAFVGLLALGSVAVAACTTTEIRQVPASSGSSGTPGEDAGVDPEADSGPDPYADGGSLSDSQPKPKHTVPTSFKRTLDCTAGACSGGTCTGNDTTACSNNNSPCRGKESRIKITSLTDFPLKITTPKLTSADPMCRSLCGPSDSTVHAISVGVKTLGNNLPLAIKVPPPWRVSVGNDRYGPIYCSTGGDPTPLFANQDCVAYYGSGNGTFAIVTTDPNAASVDVTVDLLPVSEWPTQFDGQCPY